jgi:hypothetical protein
MGFLGLFLLIFGVYCIIVSFLALFQICMPLLRFFFVFRAFFCTKITAKTIIFQTIFSFFHIKIADFNNKNRPYFHINFHPFSHQNREFSYQNREFSYQNRAFSYQNPPHFPCKFSDCRLGNRSLLDSAK